MKARAVTARDWQALQHIENERVKQNNVQVQKCREQYKLNWPASGPWVDNQNICATGHVIHA